ncbi:MAG: hypothetical protein EA339_05565 [Rhodobacteraceae bacterium]|nr:MAG: hypothetical protein EA339_05565 [Paracoccaceae bacterium]
MQHHGYLAALIVGSAALSACGSGSSSTSQVTPPAGRSGNTGAEQVLTETAGTAAQALAEGAALRSSERTTAEIQRNYDAQTAVASAAPTATVTRNAAGGLTLQVPGQPEVVFTPEDLSEDGYGFEKDGAGIWAWNNDGMAGQLDPTNSRDYHVFAYFVDTGDGTGREAFIVTGTETRAAALAALPSATYSGNSRIRLAPTTGFVNFATAVSEVQGNLNMSANFGSGTVFGSLTNLEGRPPRAEDPSQSWTAVDGALSLNETAISGNGFTGAVTADSAFTTGIAAIDAGSTYSGTFFGTAADGVAGAINLSGTAADGDASILGWGFFRGDKN